MCIRDRAHIIFVLATTEEHKVPVTIKSRCQQFNFRLLTTPEIAARLNWLAGKEALAIERSRAYNGRYHVLHGAISPVEGIGPEDLRLAELLQRVAAGSFREIIMATNPTLEGESTALYLQRRLTDHKVRLTRLARGLSVGGDLEYTDEITLGRAFEGRQDV